MIKRIRIRNFMSLRDVSVSLEPVTVLIGRSGTGKSNFVHALRFLRDYLLHADVAVTHMGGWERLLCATRDESTAKLSFELEFQVPGLSKRVTYVLAFRIDPQRALAIFVAESLTLGDDVLFSQNQNQWTKRPKLVDPPNPGQPVFGLLYGIPEARIAHIVLTKGIGCYDFPGNVLAHGDFHPTVSTALMGDPAIGTALMDDASNHMAAIEGISTNLSEYYRISDIVAALRRLNSSVTSVELAPDGSHVRVGHKVGEAKTLSFHLPQESEGFRRFLAHMIALNQQPPKPILTFEEPEKGIYPGALEVLADQFEAVAHSGRSQIILTTHSPQLLKHFDVQQIRVVTMEQYETKIGLLAPEQREALEEHLMTADELLTVDDARIDPESTAPPE